MASSDCACTGYGLVVPYFCTLSCSLRSIMNIGYARVSANHQNLDRQLALLKSAGCKQIFKQKQSGQEGIKRPQLKKAIDALSPSDVFGLLSVLS